MRRTAILVTALVVLGFGAALGIGLAANAISGDSIGLSAKPLRAGEALAPPDAARDDSRDRTRTTEDRTRTTEDPSRTTDDRTRTRPRSGDDARRSADDRSRGRGSDDSSGRDSSGRGSGGGSGGDDGGGRGRGRGRGGDD